MIELELPDEIYLESPDAFGQEVRLRAAAKLYEAGTISSGRAAELAGLPRIEFLHSLKRLGISALNWKLEDLEAELQVVQDLKQHLAPVLPPSAESA